MTYYIINELFRQGLLWLGLFSLGSLVYYYNVKVNYTRKIGHFAFLFIPTFFWYLFPYEESTLLTLISFCLQMLSLIFFLKPIREKIAFFQRSFLAFDRPEDRPNTLLWLSTQLLGCLIAVGSLNILFALLFKEADYWKMHSEINLLIVPLAMIGDGLAEPIGVRFGKHRYKTIALFSKKKYYRTLEGSLAVFISSFIFLCLFHQSFNQTQFLVALLCIPLLLTLTEALSPHTWDQPFLFAASTASLYLIQYFL